MNVLHLNANSAGGAFTAANRLSAALSQVGVKSRHMVFSGNPGPGYQVWADGFLKRMLALAGHAIEKLDFVRFEKNASVRFAFSHGLCGVDVTQWQAFIDADIIHLHWINKGFISLQGLEQIIRTGKPVVWTCHDMWPFTGGCYHNRGCNHFHTGCGDCQYLKKPAMNDLSARKFRQKQRLFDASNVHFVTPSAWLSLQASASPIAAQKPIAVIPNAIDTKVFKPGNATEAMAGLGIPATSRVIAFAAANLSNPKKGFYEFIALLKRLKEANVDNIHILLIGENKDGSAFDLPFPHTFTGYISDETAMVDCYQAASVYVTTSHEENLPTTIMESLACGTPVAAFAVGGIPEMVVDGETGWLSALFDVETLSNGILQYLSEDDSKSLEMREKSRQAAVEYYDQLNVARRYAELYKRVLK